MAPHSPGAAGSKKGKNVNERLSSGRGSPDSAASDATPVTNNAAAPKKKKGNLHSLWEYRATSLTGNDPGSPPTTVRTTTTAWSANSSPRVVSPVESASSSPGRDVKKEAKKFEVDNRKSEDELTLLKKELETLQGKKEESKKDAPLQKKESYLFWEQKTKDNAKNESTVPTEDDGAISDALTGAVAATAAASASTKGTPDATSAGDDTAQLMSEFRALVEKLVRKGKLYLW